MPPVAPPRPPTRRTARPPIPSPIPHRAALAAVYSTASLAAAATLPPAPAVAALATVWSSFVLAISGLEAWVKFKSPSLTHDKAAAVDEAQRLHAERLVRPADGTGAQ